METLGLEVRRGYTVVAFAERGYRPVLIGDGRRTVIPNAVRRGEWGSAAAAEHADAVWPDESSPRGLSGPHAAAFWQGLRGRLKHFLGVGDGTLSALPVVVACGDEDVGDLREPLAAAGFTDLTFASPPAAAVSAMPSADGAEVTHRVVCVGDVSAEVAAFRVRSGGTVRASSQVRTLAGVGAAYWVRALAGDLDAVRAADGEWNRLRLWQSMFELAAALDRNTPDRPRRWTGAHAEELVTDVTFRANRLDRVAEHIALVRWAEQALADCSAEVSGPVAGTWVAGVGSVFPLGWPVKVTPLPDPAHAVAVGASLLRNRPLPTPRVSVGRLPAFTPSPTVAVPDFHAPPSAPDPLPPVMFLPTLPDGLPPAPHLPDLPAEWDRLVGGHSAEHPHQEPDPS